MLDSILGFIGKGIDAWSSSSNTDKKIDAERELQERNIANQKEFAQQGIRWKVADAQAAGLHPLAALGAQTSSFSNVVGGNYDIPKTDFGGMGQDIGRAIDAKATAPERQDRMAQAIARTAQVFSLEKLNLENEQLKSNIALTRAQLPPALPGSALAHLSRSPARTADGHAISDDKVEQKPGDAPANRNYKFLGLPLLTNPKASDGQVIEDRLGDFEAVSGLTAIYNLIADMKHTARVKSGYGENPFDKHPPRNSPPRPAPRVFPYYR